MVKECTTKETCQRSFFRQKAGSCVFFYFYLMNIIIRRHCESTNMSDTPMKNTQKRSVCTDDTQMDRASHKVYLSGFTLPPPPPYTHTHTPLHTNEGLIQGYYGILVCVKKKRALQDVAVAWQPKQLTLLHCMCYNYYTYHSFYCHLTSVRLIFFFLS